jgi:hypothetical protein
MIGKVLPGVELRASAAHVIVPPSVHLGRAELASFEVILPPVAELTGVPYLPRIQPR